MPANPNDMPYNGDFRFHVDVSHALHAETVKIADFSIGQVVRLDLLDIAHVAETISLDIRYERPMNQGDVAKFSVIDGQVPDEIIETNCRYGVKLPRMVGGPMLVKGACNAPPLNEGHFNPTLVKAGHIDRQRDLWTVVRTGDHGVVHWIPYVMDFELIK